MTDSPAPPKKKNLTPKQQLFVASYIASNHNATKAAKAAGYSEATAYSQGARLLKNVEIRAAIDAYLDEATMGAKEVLYRLTRQGRADMADITNADGLFQMSTAQENGVTSLIKSITHTTTTFKGVETVTLKVDLYDAQAALALLGKHHKLFTERVQVDDWRSQAIQDIKDGRLDYPTVRSLFDDTLAQELFRAAGVRVTVSGDESES